MRELEKRQLTYSKLEKLLGLVNVSEKMRGEKNFTVAQVAKLVEIFGLSVDYLMMRDEGLSAILSKAEKSANLSKACRSESPYKNLLCEMDKRKITYRTLGELMVLSHNSISLKMLGKVKFSERDTAKLVEISGKPADYLMARDE